MENSRTFHKSFRLNGEAFSTVDGLIDYSKTVSQDAYLFLCDWFNEKETISVNTSGSTGKPKTISLKKEHMINSAKATGAFFDLPEKTTALLCLLPKFIAGKMMLLRALVLGWELDIIEPGSNPLERKKCYDFCAMVPLQLENSLSQLHRIEKLIVGGAPVSNGLIEKLQNVKTAVYATYGMTETITHIAVKKLNHKKNSSSVYKTLPDVGLDVDKRGCLIINVPKISIEPIITNDLVTLVSDTEFKWLGRFDAVINSGGIKLIPEEIEKKLATIILDRFFVTGISDAVLGEKLVLIVESEKSSSAQNLKSEISKLKILTKYEIPKEVFFIRKFIETETRKVNRLETLNKVLE